MVEGKVKGVLRHMGDHGVVNHCGVGVGVGEYRTWEFKVLQQSVVSQMALVFPPRALFLFGTKLVLVSMVLILSMVVKWG